MGHSATFFIHVHRCGLAISCCHDVSDRATTQRGHSCQSCEEDPLVPEHLFNVLSKDAVERGLLAQLDELRGEFLMRWVSSTDGQAMHFAQLADSAFGGDRGSDVGHATHYPFFAE